jgi:uncharacterized protein Yka (UPF0111/DUF47 family)
VRSQREGPIAAQTVPSSTRGGGSAIPEIGIPQWEVSIASGNHEPVLAVVRCPGLTPPARPYGALVDRVSVPVSILVPMEAMVRLIPRDEKYFTLMANFVGRIRSGAEVFVELLADYEHRARYAERIKVIEEECDDLAAEIIGKLNSSFITPIDREDIYLLTTRADDIIDKINGLARRLEISHAVPLRPDVPEIAGILADSLADLDGAFIQLKARGKVSEHSQRVRLLEKRADVLYADALHRLFTEEPNAVEVVKWASIYEQLEDAIDRCKHLAESLESVVVKHS